MNFQELLNLDVLSILDKLNGSLTDLASKMHITPIIFYVATAVLALIIGLAGMHLAKVLMSFTAAGIGFACGAALFSYLKVDLALSWMAKIPDGFGYVLGLVIAIVLFIFGWKKCLNVIFLLFALVGFIVMNFYVPNHALLCVGGALLIGMIAMCIVRVAFVALTAAVAGFVLVNCIGEIWTGATWFLLGTGAIPFWVAVGLGAVCFIIQLVTTRNYYIED